MSSPPWQVVVLSWNGREDTLACLESLRATARPDVGVICVDNGSADGSADAVAERFPEVALLRNDENLGFSGGNNRGIRHALEQGADWVVLLNNDATMAPDAVQAFAAAAARHPAAGALAGKVYFADPPDRVWFAGQRVGLLTGYSGRPRGFGRPDGPRWSREEPTDRAVGAFMAVSRPALERAGLLDEDLFAYVEDVDWSLRIREADFEVMFVPEAAAWHRVAGSTGGAHSSTHSRYYGARNTVAVVERHRPLGPVGTRLRRAFVLATFTAEALIVGRSRAAVAAVWEGYRDARAGRFGPRPVSARS